jgi:hypothetical protein
MAAAELEQQAPDPCIPHAVGSPSMSEAGERIES